MEHVENLILIFGSSLITFLLTLLLIPSFIKLLIKNKIIKNIRENSMDGKKSTIFSAMHANKSGTPTMGGVLIWGTVFLVVLCSLALPATGFTNNSLISREETYLPLFTLLVTAILGAVDDLFNIRGVGKVKGIAARPKIIWLTIFAFLGSLWFYYNLEWKTRGIHIPRLGDFIIGFWYIPLFIFVIIGTANAVNITDGLDGLAGGLLIIAYGVFGALSYAKGLYILSTFCGVVCGSTLAFLWFNLPPAKFYMGDTGSLSLGATLGVIAMMTNSVAVLPIVCFVFVLETLSVILQIFSKKIRGKKIFAVAPIHHHFEYLGWPEHLVTMRFWIIGGIFGTVGLIVGLIGMGDLP